MEYYRLHEVLSPLLQINRRRGPSFFGGADEGRGGVRVGAEQSGDGVVAWARVIRCEHHLRENTDSVHFQPPDNVSCGQRHWKSRAKVIILILLFWFWKQNKRQESKPGKLTIGAPCSP